MLQDKLIHINFFCNDKLLCIFEMFEEYTKEEKNNKNIFHEKVHVCEIYLLFIYDLIIIRNVFHFKF